MGGKDIFLSVYIDLNLKSKMCSKNFENRLTNKKFILKNVLNREFCIEKSQAGEVSIFLEKFKILNILSKMLQISIKCSGKLA